MEKLRALIESAGRILADEAAGRLEGLKREGALLTLDASPTVVVGDIHGDLTALRTILEGSGIIKKIGKGWRLVFLGDYADRGPDPLGVYEAVLELKTHHPNNVVLMKGNHEALEIIPFEPHDLPHKLRSLQGGSGDAIYESLLYIQSLLPSAAIYGGSILLIHGGVFPGITRSSLARPSQKELEMMLWNDPYEEADGVSTSPRGAGVRFGYAVTAEALRSLGVGHIVRSHSAVPKGYRFSHRGRVLTVFSSKHVYGLDSGAYLVLEGGRSIGDGIRLF
jgi:protein phosphatase